MRKQPCSTERDSAISALSRMDKEPSLKAKILYRVKIVSRLLDHKFPDLETVAKRAVDCRNFFVHGGSDFNFGAVEKSVSFFTETLEFIFVASDLIQAKWDAGGWNSSSHTSGHWFTRFRADYPARLEELKLALAKPPRT